MKLWTLLILLFSFTANAQSFNRAITRCYKELGFKCAITLIDEKTGVPLGVVLNKAQFPNISQEVSDNLAKAGMLIQAWAPDAYHRLYRQSSETKYVELEQEIIGWTEIPDEQWAFYFDTTTCAAGAVICGWSLWSTIVTGGAAYGVAAISCGVTVYQCISAQRSWQKWENYQIRKRNELRKKGIYVPFPGQSGASTGGTGDGSGGSDPANIGTGEGYSGEVCVPNQINMGGGPKGAWIEEQDVQCYPV